MRFERVGEGEVYFGKAMQGFGQVAELLMEEIEEGGGGHGVELFPDAAQAVAEIAVARVGLVIAGMVIAVRLITKGGRSAALAGDKDKGAETNGFAGCHVVLSLQIKKTENGAVS